MQVVDGGSYGGWHAGNDALLQFYGFVERDNAFDTFVMTRFRGWLAEQLGMSESDLIESEKLLAPEMQDKLSKVYTSARLVFACSLCSCVPVNLQLVSFTFTSSLGR